MNTRTRRVDNQIEKAIVIGLIVSTDYARRVQPVYHNDLLAVPFARTVAGWCLDYLKQYGQAPDRQISDIFAEHVNTLDVEQAAMIEDFLAGLSDEFEHAEAGKFNTNYLFDKTVARFDARNQELLVADVRALHAKGDYTGADDLIRGYRRVEAPGGTGIEPFTDNEAIRSALDTDKSLELFKLPGALGELVGPIEREDFIGILAPEKRGKSWRLLDLAVRALRAGCNVAYFDAGDMSQDQVVRRLMTRVTGRSPKRGGPQRQPVLDCWKSQADECRNPRRASRCGCTLEVIKDGMPVKQRVKFEDVDPRYVPCILCVHDDPHAFKGAVWYELVDSDQLTAAHAVEAGKRIADRSRKRFKLSCHANSTLTVVGMEAVLDRWERDDGFVPDVVLADYFDIFAPEDGKAREERHVHDARWRAGRRLTQVRHCALITVTQSDAAGYDQRSLRLKNFSEAKSKYAHCTKFWALNQLPEEKRDMIIRLATLIAREDDFDVLREVVIAQDISRGQPYLFSYFY